MDPQLDSSNPSQAHSPDLLQWAKSGSPIDLTFGNIRAMAALTDISYLPSGLWDHAPLELYVKLWDAGRSNCWRLAPKWVQDLKVGELISPKIAQYWESNEGSATSPMV